MRSLTFEDLLLSVHQLFSPEASRAQCNRIARGFISLVTEEVEKYGRCSIPGLGVLYRHESKARRIRDIATGELRTLEPRWSLKLRAAKKRKGVRK